ncbi:MAG: hypothetical protein P8X80_09910 [Desulfobacterales bacterium]
MSTQRPFQPDDFDLSFKVFHELMARKVTEILLVSSPYDAFIMEEEGRLAERIIHEYRGLNLSRPPMLTWVSSAHEALEALSRKKFDLVITMPQVDETDAYVLGRQIKSKFADLPVFLMIQNTNRHLLDRKYADRNSIDRLYVWNGNSDLLLALIKNLEDRMNVAYDTRRARVRVIVIVEDSPIHYSSLLPLLYKEIVTQTQAVMEESLNDEHRIVRMRARPKILVAQSYEEAVELYQKKYRRYFSIKIPQPCIRKSAAFLCNTWDSENLSSGCRTAKRSAGPAICAKWKLSCRTSRMNPYFIMPSATTFHPG